VPAAARGDAVRIRTCCFAARVMRTLCLVAAFAAVLGAVRIAGLNRG
jgi:hypothetical protein